MEARCAESDTKVPLEGTRQAARAVVLGVPSGTWHAGLGRREDLGEVARERFWLELPFQSFLSAIGLLHPGRSGKPVVGCMHGCREDRDQAIRALSLIALNSPDSLWTYVVERFEEPVFTQKVLLSLHYT